MASRGRLRPPPRAAQDTTDSDIRLEGVTKRFADTLAVDETWFKHVPSRSPDAESLYATLADQQREMIEAALRVSKGRVAGPFGAAAKLGIPRQTLDSKIAALGINKSQFKT